LRPPPPPPPDSLQHSTLEQLSTSTPGPLYNMRQAQRRHVVPLSFVSLLYARSQAVVSEHELQVPVLDRRRAILRRRQRLNGLDRRLLYQRLRQGRIASPREGARKLNEPRPDVFLRGDGCDEGASARRPKRIRVHCCSDDRKVGGARRSLKFAIDDRKLRLPSEGAGSTLRSNNISKWQCPLAHLDNPRRNRMQLSWDPNAPAVVVHAAMYRLGATAPLGVRRLPKLLTFRSDRPPPAALQPCTKCVPSAREGTTDR